ELELFRPTRRAALGALLGAIAALTSAALTALSGGTAPFPVVPVLAIAGAGLGLGATAAFYAYVVGAVILIILGELGLEQPMGWVDSIRFALFIVGSPLLILLAQRVEQERRIAGDAHDRSTAAQLEANAEREALRAARAAGDRALARAEQERTRLEKVAEAIPEPLIVYDGELRGTYGNRAALRVFGRSFFERPIDEWGRSVEPRDDRGNPLPRAEWPQVRAQHETYRRRLTVRLPMSDRDLIVDVEGTPIAGGGCVLLLRDIGKEEDERRRLSRFASFVAHELRNPLAVAKTRLELTLRESDLPAKSKTHARRGLESVDAAIGILERLELYSRADSGGIEVQREQFEIGSALAAAVERLRARGSQRAVDLRGPGQVEIMGDRYLSEQAITNLLINADRYSDPGGGIRVEVLEGDHVTLRVIDDGPGVANEVADRLFRDRVAAGRGLGLGLYLVAATMQAQGGSVELEQRQPRAIFTLRWPRAGDRLSPG
ncbi:MAG: PAS domain-containing sensor histidine kinase, partial [Chloroflexota bacterium]|nr:PAS domain-containing sensor histidine kinase [Chloroflexota bacterium]